MSSWKGTPPIHLCSWALTLYPVPFTGLRGSLRLNFHSRRPSHYISSFYPRSEELEWGQTEVGLAKVFRGKQIVPTLLTSRQSLPVVAQQEVLIEGLRVMASEEAGQRET